MDYTVIFTVWNKTKQLNERIQDWWNLPLLMQPNEIIVLDDGSDDPPQDSNKVRVIHFKHTGNLSHIQNIGVDECKTDWLIFTDPSHIVTLEYLSILFSFRDEKILLIPTIVNVIRKEDIKPICTPLSSFIDIPNGDYFPNGPSLMNKKTFLYFNEFYDGYGMYDIEYGIRWLLAGYRARFCTKLFLFHIEHERGYFTRVKEIRNRYIYDIMIEKYKNEKITSLKDYPNRTIAISKEQEEIWQKEILPHLN
jgi:glycosyltransferase involved in cell wall biosynthesis